MFNLIIGLLLCCGSLGITLSKITSKSNYRKPRQHDKPLTIDREFTV